MQTIQDIINQRKFLTEQQQESLVGLLTFKSREAVKRELIAKIKYNLYSTFDNKDFSKRIGFKDGIAIFIPVSTYSTELTKIRLAIIGE